MSVAPERDAVVELRCDPVACFDHLARDLGIARFGRIHERESENGHELNDKQTSKRD